MSPCSLLYAVQVDLVPRTKYVSRAAEWCRGKKNRDDVAGTCNSAAAATHDDGKNEWSDGGATEEEVVMELMLQASRRDGEADKGQRESRKGLTETADWLAAPAAY